MHLGTVVGILKKLLGSVQHFFGGKGRWFYKKDPELLQQESRLFYLALSGLLEPV